MPPGALGAEERAHPDDAIARKHRPGGGGDGDPGDHDRQREPPRLPAVIGHVPDDGRVKQPSGECGEDAVQQPPQAYTIGDGVGVRGAKMMIGGHVLLYAVHVLF
jgi:hypothetical protein